MDIGDIFKPFEGLVGVLTRFGEALNFRQVVLPAAVFSGASLFSFATGFSSLLSNILGLSGSDGSFPIDTGKTHLFFGIVFAVAFVVFWLTNKFLTGVLLKYILVYLRPGALADRETLDKVLEFIKDPKARIASLIESRSKDIAAVRAKLASDVNNSLAALERAEAPRASAEQKRSPGWIKNIAQYIAVTRAKFSEDQARRNLDAAREELNRFDKLQESTARAPTGLKALSEIARLQTHISDLLREIDELQKPGGGNSVDWKDIFRATAEMIAIVGKLAHRRRKLLASLLEFGGLIDHFTNAELHSVANRSRQLIAGDQLTSVNGSFSLHVKDVIIPYDLLREATLANGVTAESSEDYWADKRAAEPPHRTLTEKQCAMIETVDRLRNQAVMYAVLFAALVLAAPCLILVGRTLSDPLRVIWIPCAVILLWLANKARQLSIWTTVVVRIRERQLEQTMTP